MQIELLGAQRRVQSRVPLPSATFDRRKPDNNQCRPVLQFKDIPIDWTRLPADGPADGRYPPPVRNARDWPTTTASRPWPATARSRWLWPAGMRRRWPQRAAKPTHGAHEKELLDQVLLLAMRPFLARCAEALLPRLELSDWQPALLPALRRRARVCVHQSGRRALADLQPLHGSVAIRSDYLPLLREQRSQPHHVIYQPRRPLSHLRLRRMPPVPEGLRWPRRQPSGHAGGRLDRDAAPGRSRDPARISELTVFNAKRQGAKGSLSRTFALRLGETTWL